MSRGYPETLISLDLAPLRAALGDITAEIKKQAEQMQMLIQASDAAAVRFSTVDKHLADVQAENELIRRGFEDIKRLDEKLESWGERLKGIEERHVITMATMNEMQMQAEAQNRRVSDDVCAIKEHLEVLQETNPLLRNEEDRKRTEAKMKALEDRMDDMRMDYKLSITQVDQSFSRKVEKLAEMLEVGSPKDSEKESFSAAAKKNPLKDLSARISGVETNLAKLSTSMFTSQLEKMGVTRQDLSTPEGQENFKMETQLKLQMLAQEINGMKLVLDEPVARTAIKAPPKPQSSDTSVINVRVGSLADRLADLERRPDYGFLADSQTELERRVKNITESLNLALTWQRDFVQSQLHSKIALPAPELIVPQLPVNEIKQSKVEDEQQTDKSGSMGNGINELWSVVGELNLKMKALITKEEVNGFIDSVHSRFKQEEAKAKALVANLAGRPEEEGLRRVSELEQRLLASSKGVCELQEELKHQKHQSTHQLQITRVALESKIDEVKSALTSLDRKWFGKVEDLSALCERRSQLCPFEDDLTMIRSLVMKMRTDLQVVREIQEAQQAHPDEAAPIVTASANLDQIADSPELAVVKSVLQQHELAIKYFSSKMTSFASAGTIDDGSANRQELTLALHHLDELKQEMMEIMAKQEASKTLSQKDFDLLNEIYSALDTKISKDELMQKVDKEELLKMFKILKRKTDVLSETLRKNEQFLPQAAREDAYFLRKRLDKDCAACGQTLPENADVQNSAHLSWSRFPVRSANIGPGFSRILNSLVISADGSMRLPERVSPRTEGGEDISASLSGNLTAKSTKKSMRFDLKSESTVRHKVNVSTRLPAVKASSTKM